MLLNEFFGNPLNLKSKEEEKNKDSADIFNDLYWFILDHDRLHKDYFLPLAQKIKSDYTEDQVDKSKVVKSFLPIVKKGCSEYYRKNKLKGKPEKIFTRELLRDTCERLYDHYCEDIFKDQYKLG